VKLLPLIVSAVFVVVALVLTIAVANSTPTQEEVTALHPGALMRFYEGNRRFDGIACNTPLGDFDLRCMLAQHRVTQFDGAD
jgi:hypothetical protein